MTDEADSRKADGMKAILYEAIRCEGCGCAFESIVVDGDTFLSSGRKALHHRAGEDMPDCKYAGKTFEYPRVELEEVK